MILQAYYFFGLYDPGFFPCQHFDLEVLPGPDRDPGQVFELLVDCPEMPWAVDLDLNQDLTKDFDYFSDKYFLA